MLAYSLDKFERNIKGDCFNQWKTVVINEFPTGVEAFVDLGAETCSDGALYIEAETTVRGEASEEDRQRNIERAARRAKTQVRRKCKMLEADCMITLTYRENVTDETRVQADFKAFRKRLSALGKFHYVSTLERQQRGALHVHIACQSFPKFLQVEGVRVKSFNLLRSMWRRVVGTDNGNVDVTRPRGRNSSHRIASYIAKYVAKSIDGENFNKKSYWSSTGIAKPKVSKYYFSRETSDSDIVALLAQDFFLRGYHDIAQFHDKLNEFYWFAASKS